MHLYPLQHFCREKPAAQPTGSKPLHCSGSHEQEPLNRQARGPGVKPIAGQSTSAIYTPKRAGKAPPHQTNASSHTSATSDALASANGAHWLRRTRVITAKQLTQLIAAVRNAKSRSAKHHQLTIAILNWGSAASRKISYVKIV